MIGTKLAHYEITSHLGSGGMGDVYQATDSKLGRSVAVKFLPEAFIRDADRIARFEREARVLASLNHPNIAAIYGLEDANDKKFLVMELISGETLAERISRGPIPIEEALGIAKQIADALQAAHDQGIVHRDLKPANIKITADDKVKVLDFGLAKASQPDGGSAIFSNSPTMISTAATNTGMIVGTAAYMSPEQARGKKVDQRADIWAFGVVFYEMLTGHALFNGEDVTEIMASVVKDKPDLSLVPRPVRRLLEACLEKDPGKRLQSIGDMRLLLTENEPAEAIAATAAPTSLAGKLGWLLAAVGALLAAIAFWAPWRKPPNPPEMVRFQIEAPPGTVFTNWMNLSPDGKKIAFTARNQDGVRLWVRPIDSLEAKAIAPTSGNPVPFWSPDSRWIAYQQDGKLRKVEAAGGPSQIISDAPVTFGGGSFTPDGSAIVFGGITEALKKVSSSGGIPVAITTLDAARQDTGHYMPAFLPDGKHFLYHRQSSNPDNTGTFVGSLDDKPDAPVSSRLVAESFNSIYAPSSSDGLGYVLFRRERALLAQSFDESKLAVSGEPVLVADPVGNMSFSFLNAAVSGRTLIVRETGIAELRQITWIDRNGAKVPAPITPPGTWAGLTLSADGTQAAAHRADDQGNIDIYTIDLMRQLPTRLTFGRMADLNPVWSPDRTRIVFTSEREGRNLYWKASNGSTQEELLYKSPEQKIAEDWSRDNKYILFTSSSGKSKGDIWTLSIADPEHKATLFLGTEADEGQGRFSPDGRYVIYRSDESGTQEIYMRTFPDTGGKWQISKGGGANPRWSRDGKEIYFTEGPNTLAVKVSTSPTVQLTDAVKLFTGYDGGSYDVASDGRFLMALTSGQNSVNPITVTLHWQTAFRPH